MPVSPSSLSFHHNELLLQTLATTNVVGENDLLTGRNTKAAELRLWCVVCWSGQTNYPSYFSYGVTAESGFMFTMYLSMLSSLTAYVKGKLVYLKLGKCLQVLC